MACGADHVGTLGIGYSAQYCAGGWRGRHAAQQIAYRSCSGGGVCRSDAEHAAAGHSLHRLLRRAVGRAADVLLHRSAPGADAEQRRLYGGNPSRRSNCRAERAVGGGKFAGHEPVAGPPPRYLAAGFPHHLRPAWKSGDRRHSRFLTRLGRGGGRSGVLDGDNWFNILPFFRDLRGRGGGLSRAVPERECRPHPDRATVVPPTGGRAMNDVFAYFPLMLKAAGTTLWLSWLAMLAGAMGGVLLALVRLSRVAPLRWLAVVYMEFFRSIPILIVMFFAYYGTPLVLHVDLTPFAAATLALALHASATMSEVVGAGLASVGRGQWEAAQSSGLTWGQTMRHVVAPQAVRVILPPSVGVFITTLKESSLASIIGYIELTRTGLLVRESTGGGFVPLLELGVLYFLINYAISIAGGVLERRYRIGGRPEFAGAMA